MTREEAIEVLTRLEINNFRSRSGKSYLTEALVMAINALQTEPGDDGKTITAIRKMSEKDKIKSIIVKSLETAKTYDIADAYVDVVGCSDCPYWHNDCRNEHSCHDYILDKLEAENDCI